MEISAEINWMIKVRNLVSRKKYFSIIDGDSRDKNTFLKIKIPADILITDPPYCILERRRKNGELRDEKKRKRKVDDPTVPKFYNLQKYQEFTQQWLENCLKFGLKPNAPLIIWTNALGKNILIQKCSEFGYQLTGEFIWGKRSKIISSQSTQNEVLVRIYETALVFHKTPPILPPYYLPWSIITNYYEDEKHPHPCHKSFQVMEPLIRNWTKENDLILDPFVGSGGILLSGLKLGRNVQGIEILNDWYQQTKNEIDKLKKN